MAQVQALTLESLRERREEILRIASRYGAHNVRIFGSVAQGRTRPDSDIDFLVDFEPGRTVLDLSSLILDLREALDHEVNVVELGHGTPSSIAGRIAHEAVPL
jgi:predicted nucleotidyltransferase